MATNKSLLVNGKSGQHWLKTLNRVMSLLERDLEIANVFDKEQIFWRDYDLIILDASIVKDLVSTIKEICSQHAQARILVFSSAPDWKEARDVILAGAVDYTKKISDDKYVLLTIEKALAK